jgi:hypothetical protein
MDVAVGMPDLWPFVKRVKSTVSFFHSQVQRCAVLKRNSERCQTKRFRAGGMVSGLPVIRPEPAASIHGLPVCTTVLTSGEKVGSPRVSYGACQSRA